MFAVENRHQPGYLYPVHHLTGSFLPRTVYFREAPGRESITQSILDSVSALAEDGLVIKTNVSYQHTGYNNTMYIL